MDIIEILVGVIGLALAIFWLIFPWMVCARLDSLIEGQKKLNDLLQTLGAANHRAQETRPLPIAAEPTRPTLHSFRYFYSRDGTDSGPHTLPEMLKFWQSGTLNSESLVVREGDSEWRPFSQFPEFRQS